MSTNRTLSDFIDFSRWISAFLVVIGHAGAILINRRLGGDVLSDLFIFVSGLGDVAVIVFFVISGFLVGGRMLDTWLNKGPQVIDYFAGRFSRIYIVLIPALTLGYGFDVIGLHYFNDAGLYTDAGQHGIRTLVNAAERLNLSTYVGNLLLLQGVSVTSLGSNNPLWSLAYEWWYYCVFGIAIAGLLATGWRRIVWWICLAVLLYKLPEKILLWMMIWLMGTATYFFCKVQGNSKRAYTILAICVLGVLARNWNTFATSSWFEAGSVLKSFSIDFYVAVAYSTLMVIVSRTKFDFPMASTNSWAASFSYSIYLTHFPALLLLIAMANHLWGVHVLMPLSPISFGYVILGIALVYVFGYSIAQVTEKHTGALKRMLLDVPKFIPGHGSKV